MERVNAALAGRPALVEHIEVGDQAHAAESGMNGSPTVLVDGADPFAPEGAAPSLSCRLYREPGGTLSGAPSLAALIRALDRSTGQPHAAVPDDCCTPPNPPDAVDQCGCEPR
jgi:hypothetical protein